MRSRTTPRTSTWYQGTNRLDLLDWDGEKAGGASQENDWPRSGLSYEDGSAVPSDEVPYEIEVATILLAGTIAKTPQAAGSGTSASSIKAVKAGSAQVEFFQKQEALDGQADPGRNGVRSGAAMAWRIVSSLGALCEWCRVRERL